MIGVFFCSCFLNLYVKKFIFCNQKITKKILITTISSEWNPFFFYGPNIFLISDDAKYRGWLSSFLKRNLFYFFFIWWNHYWCMEIISCSYIELMLLALAVIYCQTHQFQHQDSSKENFYECIFIFNFFF